MKCPVCSNETFNQIDILKQRLIDEWELSLFEVDYINKQQGFNSCTSYSIRPSPIKKKFVTYRPGSEAQLIIRGNKTWLLGRDINIKLCAFI